MEYAPWQGGYYERLIGIVKAALQKTIGWKVLKFEDFRTLIYEVAVIVNSRPLTYVYDEPGISTIRPMDFLQTGSPTGLLSVGTYDDPDYILPQARKELVNLYNGNLALTDIYWELFRDEYLSSLREKQTVVHKGNDQRLRTVPKVGDIVCLKEVDLRRGEWKIGRVEAVNMRSDGYIRSVTVILSSLKRVEWSPEVLYPYF